MNDKTTETGGSFNECFPLIHGFWFCMLLLYHFASFISSRRPILHIKYFLIRRIVVQWTVFNVPSSFTLSHLVSLTSFLSPPIPAITFKPRHKHQASRGSLIREKMHLSSLSFQPQTNRRHNNQRHIHSYTSYYTLVLTLYFCPAREWEREEWWHPIFGV